MEGIMPLNTPLRRLGDIVYILTNEGVLIRNAVGQVSTDGSYALLNEDTRKHFFDLEEALCAAEVLIRYRLTHDTLTDTIRSELSGRLALLRDPACVSLLATQPIQVRQPIFAPTFLSKEPALPEPAFPTEYFEPGTPVWMIITPSSNVMFSGYWRPKPYFLLSTVVSKASLRYALGYRLEYKLSGSHFFADPHRMFADEQTARHRMQTLFAEETGGSIELDAISVFTIEEELAAWEEQLRRTSGNDSSAQVIRAS